MVRLAIEGGPKAVPELTGKPGACITTLGPGVASIVNGVACASLERAPVIVITDAAPARGTFDHQRIDHRALLSSVTKWSASISTDNVDDVMREAIARAVAEPAGPVHLELLSR